MGKSKVPTQTKDEGAGSGSSVGTLASLRSSEEVWYKVSELSESGIGFVLSLSIWLYACFATMWCIGTCFYSRQTTYWI